MAKSQPSAVPTESQTIHIPYSPRVHQRIIHERKARFSVLVCHRRFGKTVMAVNDLIRGGYSCRHDNPRFHYVAPTIKQGKRVAWDYLCTFTRNLPGRTLNHAELRVDWPVSDMSSARIQILGSEDPDSLRGAYSDGVVFDEYAQIDPRTYSEVFRPMLADRLGWAMFAGTPQGQNHFYDLFERAKQAEAQAQGWAAYLFKASQTGIVLQSELDAARREMTPAQYEQEFECSFVAAVPGAYYAELMAELEAQGRVNDDVIYDPNVPTEAWFDLGVGDATGIWIVQRHAKPRPRVLFYDEGSGLGLPDYLAMVKAMPYAVTRWIAPHDLNVRDFSLPGAPTRREVALEYGVPFEVVDKIAPEEGRDMVRRFLKTCEFNRKGTQKGRNALISHRSAWDGKNQTLKLIAVHDWSSHAADAFRYGAQAGEDISRMTTVKDWDRYQGGLGGYAA